MLKSELFLSSLLCYFNFLVYIQLNCLMLYIIRRERVMASGGEVGRLSLVGGAEVGFSFG